MIGHEVGGEYVVVRERTSVKKLSARCAGIDIPAFGRGGGLLGFSAEVSDLEESKAVDGGFYWNLLVDVSSSSVGRLGSGFDGLGVEVDCLSGCMFVGRVMKMILCERSGDVVSEGRVDKRRERNSKFFIVIQTFRRLWRSLWLWRFQFSSIPPSPPREE